jgi:hypothetical protein
MGRIRIQKVRIRIRGSGSTKYLKILRIWNNRARKRKIRELVSREGCYELQRPFNNLRINYIEISRASCPNKGLFN